jgi:hypothetical protein
MNADRLAILAAADTAFDRALVDAHAAFDRARATCFAKVAPRESLSTHAAAIVDAYAAFDRARAAAHADYARARACR